MSTLTISVEDAQSQLRDLLAMALKGGEVIIAEDEKPMVRLVPVEAIESEFVSSERLPSRIVGKGKLQDRPSIKLGKVSP